MLLVAQGVDVNGVQGEDRHTPLHVAASAGNLSVVDVLIHNGASLSALDTAGHTALHRAAAADHAGTCRLLLARGAFILAVDVSGRTAAQLAHDMKATAALAVLQAEAEPKHKSANSTPTISNGPSQEAIEFFSRNRNPANKRGSVISSLFSLLDKDTSGGVGGSMQDFGTLRRTPEKDKSGGSRIGTPQSATPGSNRTPVAATHRTLTASTGNIDRVKVPSSNRNSWKKVLTPCKDLSGGSVSDSAKVRCLFSWNSLLFILSRSTRRSRRRKPQMRRLEAGKGVTALLMLLASKHGYRY